MPNYTLSFGGMSFSVDSPRSLSADELMTVKNGWMDSIGYKPPQLPDLPSIRGGPPVTAPRNIPPPSQFNPSAWTYGLGTALAPLHRFGPLRAPAVMPGRGIDMPPSQAVGDIVSEQTSPMNLSLAVLPLVGKVAPTAASAISKGIGAVQAAHGATSLAKGDPAGLVDIGLGALGIKAKFGAKPQVLPKIKEPVPQPKLLQSPTRFIAGEQGIADSFSPYNLEYPISTPNVAPEVAANYPLKQGIKFGEPQVLTPRAAPQPAGLLASPTRFIAGREGVADISTPYALARPVYTSNVAPEIAASYPPFPAQAQPEIRGLLPAAPDFIAGQEGVAQTGRGYIARPTNVQVPEDIAASYSGTYRAFDEPGLFDTRPSAPPRIKKVEAPVKAAIPELLPPQAGIKKPRSRITFGEPSLGPSQAIQTVGTKAEPKLLPPQPGIKRPRVKFNTPQSESVQQVQKVAAKNPVVAEAIAKDPSIIQRVAKKLDEALPHPVRSIETWLAKDSPAGKRIVQLLRLSSHEARSYAAQWDAKVDEIYSGLKKSEHEEFWKTLESGAISSNPRINEAIRKAKIADDIRWKEIEDAGGLVNPDTGKPTERRTLFAPHIRPENETPQQLAENILKKWPKMSPADAMRIARGMADEGIVDRVMAATGLERAQAGRVLRIGKAQSERKIASQYSRELDLPGYRMDKNTWKEHNWDIAKKIAQQKYLGRMDIADPNSPISKLLARTSNPQKFTDMLKRQLGRAESGTTTEMETLNKWNRRAANAASAMYLSLFSISNTANLGTIPIQSTTKNFAKALLQHLVTNREGTRQFAQESGAVYNITRGILEAAEKSRISKLYGISASENFNRAVAATTGKLQVEEMFKKFKAGGLRDSDKRFLQELTLTDLSELSSQSALTKKQIENAGGMMAEITQGLAEGRRIPGWASHPAAQIPLMFKKYAYQQTRNLYEAIKRDPVRNIPKVLAASQISGELIGDTKAGLRGGVMSAFTGENEIPEQVENRGQYLGRAGIDDPLVQRAVDNLVQSWMLGILSDVALSASSGKLGMFEFMAGPAIGTAVTAADAAVNVAKGKPQTLGREVLRRVPYVGGGLQHAILPTPFQQKSQSPVKPLPSLKRP